MAKLTSHARKMLSSSVFLGPNRTFPGNDKEHLRKAIQLAPRSEHAGNISKATEESIVRKAKAKLHEGKSEKKPPVRKATPKKPLMKRTSPPLADA